MCVCLTQCLAHNREVPNKCLLSSFPLFLCRAEVLFSHFIDEVIKF